MSESVRPVFQRLYKSAAGNQLQSGFPVFVLFLTSSDGSGLPHILTLHKNSPNNCSELKIYHRGYKAYQTEGNVLLNQEKRKTGSTPVSENASSNNNDLASNKTCQVPQVSDGQQYNWWQVLLQSGGKPGSLKELNRKNNPSSGEHYVNPCERPLSVSVNDPQDFLAYNYLNSDLKTYYREERATRRLADTLDSFLEVSGRLVWVPPPELKDTRGYNIHYTTDDTGLWIVVWNDNCVFDEEGGKPTLECSPIPSCNCDYGELVCEQPISLNGNVLASLTGR